MKRDEFISVLRGLLAELPEEEIEQAVRYYEEYLDEAEVEETALSQLGSPKQIAERILADVEKQEPVREEEITTPDTTRAEPAKKRSLWKTTGLVVLLVCASPLLISLGTAALSIAIALASVLLFLILAVITPFFALSVSFIALFFVMLYWAGVLVGIFTPGAVLLCGLALLFGALGIACGIFTGHLCKWTGKLLKELFLCFKPAKKGAKAV